MEDDTIVDWRGVRALGIKLSRTHIYRMMREGTFPQSFSLSDKPRSRIVWWLSELRVWLHDRAKRRVTLVRSKPLNRGEEHPR